jgi:hypothetical protein
VFKVAERLKISDASGEGEKQVVLDDSDIRTKSIIPGCSEACLGMLSYRLRLDLGTDGRTGR